MGEDFFRILAKNAGLIVNSSDDDKGGWDFEIEHPRHQRANFSSLAYPVYRVQVKATGTGHARARITYRNLLKLIQYGGASFIFLASYDNDIKPEKGYLLHVDRDFSLTVLTEIRRKQLSNPDFKLNKNKRTIKFDESMEFAISTGACLLESINKHIGDNYLEYVQEKVDWLRQLEKESTLHHLTVSLKSEEDLKSMANCFLGNSDTFAADISAYFAPLGIRDLDAHIVETSNNSSLSPRQEDLPIVRVRLRNSEFSRYYTFDAILYTVPSYLPREYAAIRIRSTLFDIYCSFNDKVIHFNSVHLADHDLKVSLHELHSFLCVMEQARTGAEIFVEIESEAKPPLKIRLPRGQMELPKNFGEVFRILDSIYKKLSDLNLSDSTVYPFKFLEKLEHFQLLSIVGQAYKPELCVEFERGPIENIDNVNAVLLEFCIELDKIEVIFYSAFFGRVSRENGSKVVGTFARSEVLAEYIATNTEEMKLIKSKERTKLEKLLAAKGFTVI